MRIMQKVIILIQSVRHSAIFSAVLITSHTGITLHNCNICASFCSFYLTFCTALATLISGGKMILKNYLKVWRAKRDITQADLAVAVGLSRQTINSVEKG